MHLSRRTRARDALMLLCVGAAGYGAAKLFVRDHSAYARSAAAPFTLRLDFYSYSQNPAGRIYAREVTARRSDGTTVTARTGGPIEKNIQARFITTPGGARVEAHDALGLKTTYPFSSKAMALHDRLFNAQKHCLSGDSVFVRDDFVLGHRVAVVQREHGSDRMTWWLAEDLGCETLGYSYEQKGADGNWKIGIVEKASALVLGEPEPSQFVVSDSLAEAKPSETARRYEQMLGAARTPAESRSADVLDQDYERQQTAPKP